ncbi:MAG: RNA methyltransferase [Candidatus Magasanikbacteria bacterium]|nr:RNA methyltransferase [Candidatus Magasanikbacteria bacterium]
MFPNDLKKHIHKLHQKKYRKEFSEFIIEGVKGVEEALNSDLEIEAVVVEGSRREEKDISRVIALAERVREDVFFCGRNDVDTIKSADTFPGILAIARQYEVGLHDISIGEPIICLDGVRDPGNIGTIMRTADWFGIHHFLLSEDTVDPYNEKAVRSTMGSIARVKTFKSTGIAHSLEKLQKNGYSVIVLDLNGKPLKALKKRKKVIYVFGGESQGVRDEVRALADSTYTIPKIGGAESLNVAVSAATVMSHISL